MLHLCEVPKHGYVRVCVCVCVSNPVPKGFSRRIRFSSGGAERTCKALPNEALCKILGSGS